ncbi:MAG: hypothetical protein JWM58_3059 [Rhizobium sp.]|nr:hypothetical protein [Rhizobium sp.]
MRGQFNAFAALCLCMLLAACNTPDALTPKADVPNAQNTQTTQAAEQQDTLRRQSDRNNDNAQDLPRIDEEPAKDGLAPQNTLEAQQQALQRGEENPSITKADAVQADQQNTTLSAGLYKNNSDAKPANNLYSATQAKGTIRFLPIIGAPLQAVTPLSKELGNSARSNGLQIKGSSDLSAEHVLKGYLSAFSDGKNVTVVYVWDVLDNSGARLHRIQGQESVPGKSSDAWSVVPPELMQEIGTATIAEYMKWRQSQG